MLACTLLADTSIVTEGREAAGKGEVEDPELELIKMEKVIPEIMQHC